MSDNTSMKGFLEKFEIGSGFIVLTGWAASSDGQRLRQLLTLRVEGLGQITIPHLIFRDDLASAGLANGFAAFSQSIRSVDPVLGQPQVFAVTPGGDEIPLSGPGTAYSTFAPAGAFDRAGEDAVTGWIYDPIGEIEDRRSYLSINGKGKLEIKPRFSRLDLRFETNSQRLFGFEVKSAEIASAFVKYLSEPIRRTQLDLFSADNTAVATIELDAKVLPRSEADNMASGPDETSRLLTVKIERVTRGSAAIAIVGWTSHVDKTAIAAPLEFSIAAQPPVVVDELDLRSDIARHGIAGGRAGFAVVFPCREGANTPSSIRVRAGAFEAVAPLVKPALSNQIASIRVSKNHVQGLYLDLTTATRPEIQLVVHGERRIPLKLESGGSSTKYWNAAGVINTSFSISIGQLLARLRAQAPNIALPPSLKTSVGVLSGNDQVAETEIVLAEEGKGRVEVLTPSRASGWLASATGQDLAEFDVFVDGVRYLTAKADRARADLIKKKIAVQGGGFQFEPSNPNTGSNQCHIQIRHAYTEKEIIGGSADLKLPSRSQPNLDHTYATLMREPASNVSIIIPIYNASADLEKCIESIMDDYLDKARLILIDDCSQDPNVDIILKANSNANSVNILRNDHNIGFTKTINRGIEFSGRDDVIFLNSDTIVSPGWIQSLRVAAYSGPNVATATPLSNNAGVFSVPEISVENAIPDGLKLGDFARLIRHISLSTFPRVPTGNGFCMYVRRTVLDAVGPLDDIGFPVGYGEENDFCMRALRSGFEHVCDDRTFVFHRREASFGALKSGHYSSGQATLRARYPEYQRLTPIFETGRELLAVRWRIRKALIESAERPKPRIAFVISTTTGGTPQTNQDLMGSLMDEYEPFVLRCDSRQIEMSRFDGVISTQIVVVELRNRIEPTLHRSSEYDAEVMKILVRLGIELVHIRHLAWHSLGLPGVCKQLGIPVVLSFHDFYAVCPTIKLLDENRVYCAGRCTSTGGDCSVELWEQNLFPVLKHSFIHRWRKMFSAVFSQCDAFVTTSVRTREVYQDAFPGLRCERFHVIPHGRSFDEFCEIGVLPQGDAPLKILVPGNVSPAKGADLIREVLRLDVDGEVEFHILGDHGRLEEQRGLIVHGKYGRSEFASRARDIAPTVGAVLSIWPETYCHTLTEMWACGLPVIGLDVGAVGERIADHGGGWLLPLDAKPLDILDFAKKLRQSPVEIKRQISSVRAWQNGYGSAYDSDEMSAQYTRIYKEILPHLS